MTPVETGYVAGLQLASALARAVAYWLWDEEAGTDVRLFVGRLLGHPVVGGLVIAELLPPSRSIAIVLYGLHFEATVLVILHRFLFALADTDRFRWFSRPRLAVLVGGSGVDRNRTATAQPSPIRPRRTRRVRSPGRTGTRTTPK